jgi:hypothetical protein
MSYDDDGINYGDQDDGFGAKVADLQHALEGVERALIEELDERVRKSVEITLFSYGHPNPRHPFELLTTTNSIVRTALAHLLVHGWVELTEKGKGSLIVRDDDAPRAQSSIIPLFPDAPSIDDEPLPFPEDEAN